MRTQPLPRLVGALVPGALSEPTSTPISFLRLFQGYPLALLMERSLSSPTAPVKPSVHPMRLLPSRSVSLQACVETMYQCVRFWGCKGLVDSLGQRDTREADEMATFQTTLCSILVRRLRGRAHLLAVAAQWA